MARTSKNMSIYDKLNKNEQDIISAENLLKQLKSERETLLQEKDDYEMRRMWEFVKEQNLSLDDAKKLITPTDVQLEQKSSKTKSKN